MGDFGLPYFLMKHLYYFGIHAKTGELLQGCAVARLSNRAITNVWFSHGQLSGNSSYPPSSELGRRPSKRGDRRGISPVAYKPHISYNNTEAL